MNFLELRGYSRHFVKKEINRARIIPRQETLKPQPQKKNGTPFVTFHHCPEKYKHSSIIQSLQTNISVAYNNNNNNNLYLHDHNKVLQYCKSYLKLLIDSL